ncbi:hypothetical protein Y032_0107g3811 [Ancylostoma ceylanicum]|uniref:Uncharacterized protein n=1 Tax=Ancylostoma ceylanicum TaxID=53326 RepID=A0A016TFI8_9BILA|nr:hypothetical protein Y032_0107g3811 [Ancylostoma ceylanicum]
MACNKVARSLSSAIGTTWTTTPKNGFKEAAHAVRFIVQAPNGFDPWSMKFIGVLGVLLTRDFPLRASLSTAMIFLRYFCFCFCTCILIVERDVLWLVD